MIRKIIRAGGLATLALLLMMSASTAAVPAYETLAEHTPSVRPAKIAVDSAGNMYVTSTNTNTVTFSVSRYSPDGVGLGSLSLGSYPLSLYVDSANLLYVGQQNKVEIFNGSTLTGTITGVRRPVAIGSTSAGVLYILDADNLNVKIIRLGGAETNVGNAQVFGDLKDLVVDEAANEFYVLDRGELISYGGYPLYAWRVQVFDLDGNYLRKFSHYGGDVDGSLTTAMSIAIDAAGRIYLSEPTAGKIGVFDGLGNAIVKMAGFTGVDNLDFRNNKLYAVSSIQRKIYVIGIDDYAILGINPAQAAITVQGSFVSGDTTIALANSGAGSLSWTAGVTPDWLTLSTLSGVIVAGSAVNVDLLADAGSVAEGQYAGAVAVTYAGRTKTLPVSVTVLSRPVLSVTPATIDLQAVQGAVLAPGITVALQNDASNVRTWTATAQSSGWLSLSHATGPSNAVSNVTLTINTSGLSSGLHSGTVTVNADATGNGATVTVNVTVAAMNAIQVSTDNADASFAVRNSDGSVTYSGAGVSWSQGSVPDGAYTITFGDSAGYQTPAQQTKTVSGGNTISFNGAYSLKEKSVIQTLSSVRAGTEIWILDRNGNLQNQFTAFPGSIGGLDTAVADIDGDGVDEIIAGIFNNSSDVKVFSADGNLLAEAAAVFPGSGGVRLAAADFDGDGKSEIIVMNSVTKAIKVLSLSGSTLVDTGAGYNTPGLVDTGSDTYVAAGDLDGDGQPEIVAFFGIYQSAVMKNTVKMSKVNIVKILKVDVSGGQGNWSIAESASIPESVEAKGIAVADIDADGGNEIIVGMEQGGVKVIWAGGTASMIILAETLLTDVDVQDIDNDGKVEIISGRAGGSIGIYSDDGSTEAVVPLVSARRASIRISIGDLGYLGVSR